MAWRDAALHSSGTVQYASHERSFTVVIDDDESVRESLPDLLRQCGHVVRAFASAEEFLSAGQEDSTLCLILDIGLPGMSGPDLQRELRHRGWDIPVIYITGLADEGLRDRVLQAGAVECLVKPFSERALLDALDSALRSD
jgi:FixJ family two-component response regulator